MRAATILSAVALNLKDTTMQPQAVVLWTRYNLWSCVLSTSTRWNARLAAWNTSTSPYQAICLRGLVKCIIEVLQSSHVRGITWFDGGICTGQLQQSQMCHEAHDEHFNYILAATLPRMQNLSQPWINNPERITNAEGFDVGVDVRAEYSGHSW